MNQQKQKTSLIFGHIRTTKYICATCGDRLDTSLFCTKCITQHRIVKIYGIKNGNNYIKAKFKTAIKI